uniref:Uncharacterized protein n=1 Tax=Trichuris muris TaxID=70415 RepID=A0A5S6QF55_TRIMR
MDSGMEGQVDNAASYRYSRPSEWIPSDTVSSRTVSCPLQRSIQSGSGKINSLATRRVVRYKKKEENAQAIVSPYFAAKKKNRYCTKVIVESNVALRENMTQNGLLSPAKEHSRTLKLLDGSENFVDHGKQSKITDYMPHRKNAAPHQRNLNSEEMISHIAGESGERLWEPMIRNGPLSRQDVPMDPFDFTYCI